MEVAPSESSRPELSIWGLTHIGQVRSENQDSFVAVALSPSASEADFVVDPEREAADGQVEHRIAPGPGSVVLLVADGMGGVQGGATASALATTTVVRKLRRSAERGDSAAEDLEGLATRLRQAIDAAGAQIRARAAEEPALRGMGTTLTAIGLEGRRFVCAQVGDSRAYRFRDGKLEQLTRDQTVVQELVDAGRMSAEEARRSDQRNMILQALGSTDTLDVVLSRHEIQEADTLLLCSDGLSGVVDDDSLRDVLSRAESPREACEALVHRANEAGGPDNITVLIGTARDPNGADPDTMADG